MEQDEKKEFIEPENQPESPEEAAVSEQPESGKKERVKTPMARWKVIALISSVALCAVMIVVAAFLWVIGQPFAWKEFDAIVRMVKFGAVTLIALGGALLFNGLVTLNWRTLWRVILSVLGGLLLVLGLIAATWKWWLPSLVVQPIIEENVQVEEKPQEDEVDVTPALPATEQVRNIALFGIDQDEGSVGRSDALLILTIDKVHNKIKLTSLDRDSLVAIDGHGEEKLTHAWAYGHGKLAVKTLNQNFGMNITDYAYVNFTEFVRAIDYLGGVYVDVSAAERDHMNLSYNSWYPYYGEYIPKVEGTGRILLKGAQALSYSRNRSDGTTNRAARQREVLTAMLDQVMKQSLTEWPSTLGRMLQLCHTTLTSEEILEMGMWVLEESPTIENLSLPTAELKAWGGVLDRQRGWVRVYDLEAASVVLHNFIYETDQALPDSSEEPTTTESADTDKDDKTKTTVKK